MVALALKNRGLIPNNLNTTPLRTVPFSVNTTPRSYSAMNVGGMSMGAANPGGQYSVLNPMANNPGGRFSALNTIGMGANAPGGNTINSTLNNSMTPQNTFATGMQQGAVNQYAKPAPRPKVPINQLGQNLLDFASTPQGVGLARGLLEASGYSATPISLGQGLAQGLGYMMEADEKEKEAQLEKEKFDYQKVQDTLSNELALLQITSKDDRTALEKKMSVVYPNLIPGSAEYAEKALELASAGGINIDQTQESEFVKGGITEGYKAISKAQDAINAGKEIDARLEILANLLDDPNLKTGPLQEALLPLRKQLDELGFLSLEDSKDLNAQQVFFATANYIVPRMRVVGSGATSDFEAKLFKSASPNLANTKEGNKIIVAGMQAINDYNTRRFNLMEKYFAENKNLLGFGQFADQELGSIFPTYESDEEFDQLVSDGKLKVGDLVYDKVNINGFHILTKEDLEI